MLHCPDRACPLAAAVEVAITAGQLPDSARGWGQTVLLEELAPILGMARNALRNLRYREDPRFVLVLESYVASSHAQVVAGLEDLRFHRFSPIVWRRPEAQLQASRRSLERALVLLRAAERTLRDDPDPPATLRRLMGAAAAEVMACALTFFEGQQRWLLLAEAERIFLAAMAALAFDCDIDPADAVPFARFWENRASRCGLEWSNVWDDPTLPPPVGMDVARLAIRELDEAALWMRRHGNGAKPAQDEERLRQLLADKAKWLAKAGQFDRAKAELEQLSDFPGPGARSDALLVRALSQIADNQLEEAARSSGKLAELISDDEDEGALASVTAAIMAHNIELLRDRRPALPEPVQHFLHSSPVSASELVNLPRYRARLGALGYTIAAPAGSR